MNKNKVKFWNDILLFIDFLILAISGFILWLILPRGSGKLGASFFLERETWIFLHNWLSVLLIILILFHLILNWNWIVCMFRNLFRRSNKDE